MSDHKLQKRRTKAVFSRTQLSLFRLDPDGLQRMVTSVFLFSSPCAQGLCHRVSFLPRDMGGGGCMWISSARSSRGLDGRPIL